MKRFSLKALALLLFLIVAVPGQTQSPMSFSLQQAQEYAYEHNYDLRNSQFDVEIARKKVKENTAIGLPQVNGGIDYMEYIERPTQLLPGEFNFENPGEPLAVQFGSRYNATASLKASQLIYSGQYLVGLQTARAFLETAKQKMVRDKMDVRDIVAEAYIGFLILEKSTAILDTTFMTVSQMVKEARETLKTGLIEDIDVDQLALNEANLEATLISTRSQRTIAYNYLKFVTGLKQDEEMLLTDKLETFIQQLGHDALLAQPFDYRNNIDYTILKKQEYLVFMQYKLSKTAYQPSLVAFFNFGENAQRNTWNFFGDETWYRTISWGLSLSVPIWSSGSRKFAVDQARLNVDKMKVLDEKTQTALKLQYETQKKDFNNFYLIFKNKEKGLETSTKIYTKTITKYKLGTAGSTDLNQKYNQFLASESEYIQAMFDLLKSKIKLSKLIESVN